MRNAATFRSPPILQNLGACGTAATGKLRETYGPANVRFPFHLAERHRSRSVQVARQKSIVISASYKLRTKSAQSSGLENNRPRERIFGYPPTQWCSACRANPFENTDKSGRSRIGRTLSLGQVAEGMGLASNILHELKVIEFASQILP